LTGKGLPGFGEFEPCHGGVGILKLALGEVEFEPEVSSISTQNILFFQVWRTFFSKNGMESFSIPGTTTCIQLE